MCFKKQDLEYLGIFPVNAYNGVQFQPTITCSQVTIETLEKGFEIS